MYQLILFITFIFAHPVGSADDNEIHTPFATHANGMTFISTIDGYLRAIDPETGVTKWELKEEPILKAPTSIQKRLTFLPDPRDGALYMLVEGHLKKLSYSIPELVNFSPCRTTDGVLYTGSKRDVWLEINMKTGVKERELSHSSESSQCPVSTTKTTYIGRTVYELTMFDVENHQRKWNATFADYSSHLLAADISYPYQHFASSSDGHLLTVDASTGTVLWDENLGSTIVAMYLLQNDGLHKLPYTVLGKETMEELTKEAWERGSQSWVNDLLHAQNVYSSSAHPKNLFPSLFVGESDFGLYATSAFVDERTITIAPKYIGPPLLEGPMPIALQTGDAPRNLPSSRPILRLNYDFSITHRTEDGEFLLLGYHEPPEMVRLQLLFPDRKPPSIPTITYVSKPGVRQPSVLQIEDHEWTFDFIILQIWRHHPKWLVGIVVSALILVLTIVWLCGRQSGASMSGMIAEARSVQTSRRFSIWPFKQVDEESGLVQIGSISYDPRSVLGRGCEGTIVYKGVFGGRDVAVKRIVADFVRLADREVDLLKESDVHSHVIRYFCMESDSMFRYIALELCSSSLQEYVEKEPVRERCMLQPMEILFQATEGVAYLHSIKIVHRDLKPQNILFSMPNQHGMVRALISDFGLCKRLQLDRNSISRRSGLAGTDGWIAPEAFVSESSVTRAVDIFSLGCIYYYVLTEGKHPFGDSLRRQANIMQGEYSLKTLTASNNAIAICLIEKMLQRNWALRPSAAELINHPFFWSKERQLQFFSDVSDRVEKEDEQSLVVMHLERNSRGIVNNNWRQVICPALAEDLRKFRTYKGNSVRDLLRAMRNKKHHYRELPPAVRDALGEIPNQFVTYFTDRFPQLLLHTYEAMSMCADEHVFIRYYPQETIEKAKTGNFLTSEWNILGTNCRFPRKPANTFPTQVPIRSSLAKGWGKKHAKSDLQTVLDSKQANISGSIAENKEVL